MAARLQTRLDGLAGQYGYLSSEVSRTNSDLSARMQELQNAVRHNAGPITLAFHADADETTLHLTIQDDGTGYPQSVLAVLNGEPEGENAPHILGLHVVEQIINAHGGSVQFVNRDPHGAKVMMQLPLAKDENEK